MKKVYTKPLISVEVMSLDEPIANGCTMDRNDVLDLISGDFFTAERNCAYTLVETGGFDITGDGIADIFNEGHDTICYHSNAQIAFLS